MSVNVMHSVAFDAHCLNDVPAMDKSYIESHNHLLTVAKTKITLDFSFVRAFLHKIM